MNFQRAGAKDLFKEELVIALGELPHHASGIWIGHFFRIEWWILGLLRRGILQLVSCRPAIPEVAAVEIRLALVEMERREVSCVNVALWVPLRNPVIGIRSMHGNGNRSR